MNHPLQGEAQTWPVEMTRPQEEETLAKIVAAIEVEVSIRTAILLWPIGGATPLMAFLFSSCSSVRRNAMRLIFPSSNGEDTGLSILLYGFKSRWEESRLVTVCGCENRWHTG